MAGRGRLSNLDQLPEEARDDLFWAIGELNARQRTQADILFELNDRLEAKGLETVSRSAFNRKAMRLAKRAIQLEERKFIYAGIAEKLTPEEIGKSDIVLGEFLKTLIDELLDGDGLDSKNAQELARAYKDTIAAQRFSADRQEQEEARAKKKLEKAVVDATDAATKAGHPVDGAEVLRLIREAYAG
jgi:hypothetical protein